MKLRWAAIGSALVMTLGVGGALLSTAATAGAQQAPTPQPLTESSGWLETVNFYRTSSGLAPVTANASWVDGQIKHLIYLANTPTSMMTGEYANAHTENPASPWYTPEGDLAGRSSNLGGGPTERSAIEGWMTAPFHSIGVMRPGLTEAAFASRGGAAALDVIRGLAYPAPPGSPDTVLFPGRGSETTLREFRGESPDPRDGCAADWHEFRGLPIYAMLPESPASGTTAVHIRPDGSSRSQGAELCVHTGATYNPADPVYGATGKSILAGGNVVMIIPREPLAGGNHVVTVRQPGREDVTWSFSVVVPPEPPQSVRAVWVGPNQVRVQWAPTVPAGGVPNAAGYQVQLGNRVPVTVGPAARSAVLTVDRLSSGTEVRVHAVNGAGASAPGFGALGWLPDAQSTQGSFTVGALTGLAGQTAALVNLTMVGAGAPGYITADRCSQLMNEPQQKSNGNHGVHQAVANLSIVGLDLDGALCVYGDVPTSVIVDVQGSFSTSGVLALSVMSPRRLFDSRGGASSIAAGSITRIQAPAAGADAALVNLVMTDATTDGYITAGRCSELRTGEQSRSNGNHTAISSVSNLSVVAVDADGSFCVYNQSATHLVADIQGIFTAGSGERFMWSSPRRVIDTRTTSTPGANTITRIETGVPAGTTAALVNVTMAGGVAAGYVTADRCSNLTAGQQTKSTGNHGLGAAVANLAVVPVDADGAFCVYTERSVDVIVDLQGSFAPGGALGFTVGTPQRALDTRW